ncbi:MAG: ATP-binding cassette domain-containing protein, partial [Chloroflexota bacterium]
MRLSKAFGRVRAVSELDLRVPGGEIYGLLGPNGSGKTTVMRLLVGLAKADSGEARVLGRRVP